MTNGRLAQSQVGVLGSGEVGRRLASGFRSRGHKVMVGSRDPGKSELREWVLGDGVGIELGTFAQAAAFGELARLGGAGRCGRAGDRRCRPDNFSDKVLIDTTNPLDFSAGFPPKLSIGGEDSLGECVQRALP
jgi:predicted dinucleotide-binding enzyme